MQRIDGKNMNVLFTTEQMQKIEKIAKRHNKSKTETVRLLVETGIDAYEAYAMIGVPQLAELIKRTRRACEKEIQPDLI